MNCLDTQKLIHAYLDFELDLMTSLGLEDHLQECSTCRERHAELKTLRDRELMLLHFHSAPAGLKQSIAASLRAEVRPASGTRLRVWQTITAASLMAALFAAWVALPSFDRRPTQLAARNAEKIVYHIANSNEAHHALRNVSNHLAVSPHAKVVVVAHNQGVDFLLRGAKDVDGKLFEYAVAQLTSRGVAFRICQNTLTRRHVGTEAVIPEANFVPSGIAEISRLQTQEGYAYMRL